VDFNVTNGVVTLVGDVPNAQVKAEAEQEARSVSGVTRVINNLQVKAPRPTNPPHRPGRADIQARLLVGLQDAGRPRLTLPYLSTVCIGLTEC